MRTYALFKIAPGFETYLDEISCVKERTALTKFRISNHGLMIERGRYSKIDKELRFCPFCPGRVEDEKHFLLECHTYKYLRSDLYNEVKIIFPSITNQPNDYRFLALMKGVSTSPVSRFILRAMGVREFLIAKNKTHD